MEVSVSSELYTVVVNCTVVVPVFVESAGDGDVWLAKTLESCRGVEDAENGALLLGVLVGKVNVGGEVHVTLEGPRTMNVKESVVSSELEAPGCATMANCCLAESYADIVVVLVRMKEGQSQVGVSLSSMHMGGYTVIVCRWRASSSSGSRRVPTALCASEKGRHPCICSRSEVKQRMEGAIWQSLRRKLTTRANVEASCLLLGQTKQDVGDTTRGPAAQFACAHLVHPMTAFVLPHTSQVVRASRAIVDPKKPSSIPSRSTSPITLAQTFQ